MAVGVPIYTGENAGGVLKQSTGERVSQAQEKMSDRILEAEKFKYTERKREEAEFLKNAYIKPEYLISAKARTDMAKGLQEFNQRWTKTLKDNKGILPFDLKVQMQNEKALLESTQNDLLEQMGQWKMMNDAVLRDNGVNYDKDEWDKITSNFLETGRIDITQPPLKSINPFIYFQQNPVVGTLQPGSKREVRNGVAGTVDINLSGTLDEGKSHVEAHTLNNPRLLKGTIELFQSKATEAEKMQYLDVNKDNAISADEMKNTNGILEWAKDKFAPLSIKEQAFKWTKTAGAGTTSKFNKNLPIGPDNNRNDEYELLGEQRIRPAFSVKESVVNGEKVYERIEAILPDFVPLDYANKTPIVLPISEVYVFDESGNKSKKTLSPSHQIPVQVLGFSPTANVLMVQALDDSSSQGGADKINKDNKIALDASTYDKYIKQFGIYREGYKKKETPTVSLSGLPTMSWEEWSMKNPQRTRQEYDLEMGKGAGRWDKNKR